MMVFPDLVNYVQHGRCVEQQQVKGRAAIRVHDVNTSSAGEAFHRIRQTENIGFRTRF
jgi:hypothetical protein